MNDYIDFSNVSEWFEEVLRRHHLLRYSQLTSLTERQLLGLGLGVGSVRHAYLLLEQEGLSFRNGEDCLCRIGFQRYHLKQLMDCCDDLNELESYSENDLVHECGFSRERAEFIASRMKYFGRPLRG